MAEVEGESSRPALASTLLALVLAALVLWAAVFFGAASFVAIAFGGLLGLVFLAVVFAGAVVGIAALTRALTGRMRWGAAVTVVTIAAVGFGISLAHFGTIPMIWIPQPGFELMYPIIAIAAALVLGLFLGPLPLRVVGALAAVGIIVVAVLAFQPEQPAVDPDAAASPEEQFAAYRQLYESALVSGVPGSSAVRFDSLGGPGPISWNLTTGGGVVQVARVTADPASEIAELMPCWMLAHPNMDLQSTDSPSDYASWCVPDAEGWARTDGLGFARQTGDVLIAVTGAEPTETQIAGGTRPATADEVRAALESLRPPTVDELRDAFQLLPH